MFSQQVKVSTVVPGDLFHILTKGGRYFVFKILSLFISIAHCLLWSNILIAVRPCHCAGIPIDPAIVRVYQSTKPSYCAGIFKQYNPALLDQNKTACLLAGHT